MKLSLFLIIKAVIATVFGIGFVLIPAQLASLFGFTLDAGGVFTARLLGAMLIGIGLICWLCRASDAGALRSITLSLCVADTLGFIVTLLAQLGGLTNALGWVNVVIWLLLALGLAYFRFLKPGTA